MLFSGAFQTFCRYDTSVESPLSDVSQIFYLSNPNLMSLTSNITNIVKDPDNNPVPGAQVVITLWTSTGMGGAFRIDDSSEVSPIINLVTDVTGKWTVALEQNSNINPPNSFYTADEFMPASLPSNYPSQGVRRWLFQVGSINQTLQAALVTQPPTGAATVFLTQAVGDARYVQSPAAFSGSVGTEQAGGSGTAGTAITFSRGDHIHPAPSAIATNSNFNDSASAGSSTSFSQADHKHGRQEPTSTIYSQPGAGGTTSGTTQLTMCTLSIPALNYRWNAIITGMLTGSGTTSGDAFDVGFSVDGTSSLVNRLQVPSGSGGNIGTSFAYSINDAAGGSHSITTYAVRSFGTGTLSVTGSDGRFNSLRAIVIPY